MRHPAVVDVPVLGPHAGDVGLVGGRIAAEHGEVGVEQDRRVVVRRRPRGAAVARTRSPTTPVPGRRPTRGRRAPARRGRALCSSLSTRGDVVHGVVEEGGDDDGGLVGERDLDGQLVHVPHDPRDVSDPVVAAVRFTMAADDVVELQRPGRATASLAAQLVAVHAVWSSARRR